MNRQIVKLFAFIVVLFGVLVGFTSYWSVFDAEALKEKEANKRPLLEQQQIRRGRILAADGTVIARSVPRGRGDNLRYVRRYPEGSLFGHPIGYSFVREGDTEFEQFHNDELVGEESEFASILDELRGREQEGNNIVTNIDAEAQRAALAGLQAPGLRRRGRDRAQHRPGQGAGLQPALRPEPHPLRARGAEPQRAGSAALQPRHPGPVPAGLDLQGRHRRGGPRQRRDHPGNADRRAGSPRGRRPAAGKRLRPRLPRGHARHRPDQLGQHLVWPARTESRQRDPLRDMDKFGFNSRPAIDLPEDAVAKAASSTKAKSCSAGGPGRHGAAGDRPGAAAGDAAADGRGRRPRSPTAAG